MLEVPGFVDLQVNGFLGVDFSDERLSEADFIRASRELLSRGCAAFLPTVITAPEAVYKRNLALIARCMQMPEFTGRILGIHVEGPFISDRPGAVGAHNPDCVRPPSVEFFNRMQQWAGGAIKLVTIAAETAGAVEFCRHVSASGVAVSLGHQLATADEMKKCRDAGATLLTHLGNGMPNEVNRHRNPFLDGLSVDGLSAMIIADGHHLPADLLKVIIRVKGLDHTLVVSDASSLAGMPPGRYHSMGNDVVIEENGYLHNPAKKCLVGSSAMIFGCVKVLCELKALTPEEIVKLAFYNPLRAIKVDPAAIRSDCRCVWSDRTGGFELEKK